MTITHLLRVPHRIRQGMPIAIWCDDDVGATKRNEYVGGDMERVNCPKCISSMKKTLAALQKWNETYKEPETT